ncbi:zinc ribbon domain-containing protein [uncultured Methanobrevibacter sp.]|uniref:zinc ribbon domain-containing protein n=1 Tax=uncultured Methanobrevibacter sp. TaxID=253161 RepID=UPI00261E2422
MSNICSNCGFDNEENAKFCKKCGNSLIPVSTPQKESFFSSNKVLIIAIAVILCVSAAVGAFVYMNMNQGPQLSDFGISEFVEGDEYLVALVDENGTPMEDKIIELVCYNDYGGSVRQLNFTDYEGKTSFPLDFMAGSYKIDVIYTDEDIPELGWRNVTQYTKTITIKEGPHSYFNEEFLEKNKNYLVNNVNITVNPDSYDYETISGYDDKGNEYAWFGGGWFHIEDISNGNVNVIE